MTARKPPSASSGQEKPQSDAARERLAAALRENLKRRKAQARAREAAPGPAPESGADSADDR